jgi:hypothetical protein
MSDDMHVSPNLHYPIRRTSSVIFFSLQILCSLIVRHKQLGMTTSQQFGVSPPISVDGPTQEELLKTEELMKELQSAGVFELDDEARTR